MRWLLGALFIAAGVLHFIYPDAYASIIPPALPSPRLLVFVSGVFEVLGGIGVLLSPPLRIVAGWGLACLLVAVFPANVYMALAGISAETTLGQAALWLRLPVQGVLIGWALWASGAWQSARLAALRRKG